MQQVAAKTIHLYLVCLVYLVGKHPHKAAPAESLSEAEASSTEKKNSVAMRLLRCHLEAHRELLRDSQQHGGLLESCQAQV